MNKETAVVRKRASSMIMKKKTRIEKNKISIITKNKRIRIVMNRAMIIGMNNKINRIPDPIHHFLKCLIKMREIRLQQEIRISLIIILLYHRLLMNIKRNYLNLIYLIL